MKLTMLKIMLLLTVIFMKIEVTEAVSCNQVSNDFPNLSTVSCQRETKETLIHSDQGCHYTSASFIRLVSDKELRQSMSRKGNCWDNAPQESFFGHMKDEIDVSGCEKYRDVRAIVDDWIDYYNNERYQWQLAKLSPNEYYGYITTGIYPLKGIIDEREKEQKFPKTN